MNTKTRQTTVPADSWYSNAYYSGGAARPLGTPYSPEPGTLKTQGAYRDLEEIMVDTTSRNRVSYNPCFHYKVERRLVSQVGFPMSDSWYNTTNHSLGYWSGSKAPLSDYWSGGRYGMAGDANSGAVRIGPWLEPPTKLVPQLVAFDTGGRQYFVEPPDVRSTLVPIALRAMEPKIKADANGLVNDIIEIRQMRGVLNTISRFERNANFIFRQAGKELVKRPLREIMKLLGDVYLQSAFNISPIIGDFIGVIRAVNDVSAKLHWLRTNSGKRLTAHFRRFMNDDYADFDQSFDYILPSNFVGTRCYSSVLVQHPIRVFSATLDYQFVTDLTGGPGDRLRALLDDLGANLNPSIIWNAIPWTFVIDWVANISSWLDQFKQTEVGILVQPIQFCYSCHIRRNSYAKCGENGGLSAFNIFEDVYDRKVVALSGLNNAIPIKTGGLTGLQVSLLAALGSTFISAR